MEGSEEWFTRAMQMQTQTQMEMEASSHVQRNARKEIHKRSKSIFRRWPTRIELLPIHTCGKRTQILAQEDVPLWNLRISQINGWKGCLNLMCSGSEYLYR